MSLLQRILLRISAPVFLTLIGTALGAVATLFADFESRLELPLAGALCGALISSGRDRLRPTAPRGAAGWLTWWTCSPPG